MKKNSPPYQILEEYLQSVVGMEEAATDPFFYSRLHNRLQKKDQWTFPLRPAWLIAGLTGLLLLNGWMAFNTAYTTRRTQNTTALTAMESFADGYDLTIQSAY